MVDAAARSQPLGSPRVGRPRREPRGIALVVTLAIVIAISSLALVFARQMQTEAIASRNASSAAAARQIADGAARGVVADLWSAVRAGGAPELIALEVDAARLGDGLYWITRADPLDSSVTGFGLTPEAGKLDLNTASAAQLGALPGITPDIADAILDWRDPDDEPEPEGAESSYYLAQRPAYAAKNDDFETLGEVRLVRGVDALVFLGEDANRSGVLDDVENDGIGPDRDAPEGAWVSNVADNRDGVLDVGLVDLVTVYGNAGAGQAGGTAIDLATANPAELIQSLSETLPAEQAQTLALQLFSARNAGSLLGVFLAAEVTPEDQALLAGRVIVTPRPAGAPGGEEAAESGATVDVFAASATVLDSLEGMEPGDGARLVAARLAGEAPAGSLTWVADVLGAQKAVAVGPSLVSQSDHFSAHIIAASGDGRSFCRLRVVVDTSGATATEPPRLVFREDLSALGWPLDPQILLDLRGGMSADEVARLSSTGATP